MEIKFCVEDTVDKCYRDFTASLLSRGWKKLAYRKKTKLEKKRYLMNLQFHVRLIYLTFSTNFLNGDFPIKMYRSSFVL